MYDESVGLSSACDVVDGKDSLTYFECIQFACEHDANTINYANNVCHLQKCAGDDLQLIDNVKGSNVLRKRGKLNNQNNV